MSSVRLIIFQFASFFQRQKKVATANSPGPLRFNDNLVNPGGPTNPPQGSRRHAFPENE